MSPAFRPLQTYCKGGRSRRIGIHGTDASAAQDWDSDGEVRVQGRRLVK